MAALLFASGVARAAEAPRLKVGDPAPPLRTGAWIQGEPVNRLETNKVYLVDFWATWCAPCLAGVPHLNALHESLGDKGLVIIGQNVSERDTAKVPRVVQKTGMKYRVALDDVSQRPDGVMSETWQQPTGIPWIPMALLVDQQGRIAWIGYPGELKPGLIEDVLAGRYDLAKAAHNYQVRLENRPKSDRFNQAIEARRLAEAEAAFADLEKSTPAEDRPDLDWERLGLSLLKKDAARVFELAQRLGRENADNASDLGGFAATLAAAEGVEDRSLALAQSMAERASAAAQGENPWHLATLARIQFLRGQKEQAIGTQENAVRVAGEKRKASFEQTLAAYRLGTLPAAGTP